MNRNKKILNLVTDNFYINDFHNSVKYLDYENHYAVLCIRKRKIRFLTCDHSQISIFGLNWEMLAREIDKYDKIIIHYLTPTVARFLLNYNFNGKIVLIFWGGELYFLPKYFKRIYYSFSRKYSNRKKLLFFDKVRQFLFLPSYRDIDKFYKSKKIDYFATFLRGDYDFFLQEYPQNIDLKYIEFAYQEFYPTVHVLNTTSIDKSPLEINVQIGNSAEPGNNHYEAISILKSVKGYFNVFCPLSYGDYQYAQRIKKEGMRLLGDRFVALDTFLSKEKYLQYLEKIDVAIFFNPYQQGAGNVIQLIGMGKTVYLDKKNTLKGFFDAIGVKTFDLSIIVKGEYLQLLNQTDKYKNVKLIESYFSKNIKKSRFENLFKI